MVLWVVDNLLLDHVALLHVLDLAVHLLIFWAEWVGGSSQNSFTISTFLLEHSFMLKSYRAVGGGWVAYKTLVSAPVPIWIGIRGLGLGLDNSVNFINRCC